MESQPCNAVCGVRDCVRVCECVRCEEEAGDEDLQIYVKLNSA